MDAYPADIWQGKLVATRRDALVNLLDVMGGSEYDADGIPLDEAALSTLLRRPSSVLAEYDLSQLTEVSLQNMHLYRQAKHAIFQGDVLFFRAQQRKKEAPEWTSWQPYVSGNIQVIEIDSSHTGMSLPEPLAVIGQVLAQQLQEKQDEQYA
jgi:thioesterase domain-containing protein